MMGLYNSCFIGRMISFTGNSTPNIVYNYLLLIKRFVKTRKISNAAQAYLSSYAWTILGLHVLIRHGFLPSTVLKNRGKTYCEGIDFTYDERQLLPASCLSLLSRVKLFQLFELFCEYCVSLDLNIVVTLKDAGEVIKKSMVTNSLFKMKYMWGIEDPFETIESILPHNLTSGVGEKQYKHIMECLQLGLDVMREFSTCPHVNDVTLLHELLNRPIPKKPKKSKK